MLKPYLAAQVQLEHLNGRLRDLRRRISADEGGAALIEYSILIGLITVAAVATIALVGTWVANKWEALRAAIGA